MIDDEGVGDLETDFVAEIVASLDGLAGMEDDLAGGFEAESVLEVVRV